MAQEFTVSLQAIIDECKLEVIHTPQDPAKIFISNIDVNRPGLQLAGFYEYFDKGRIQIIGKAETAYLEQCGAEIRAQRIKKFFSEQPAAVVVSRGMDIMPEMRELSKELSVPLLRSEESTSTFTSKLVAYLSLQLAPRITRHGVLIEVYGEGMLILGESGVGKSETAIELIKRGHRLIADDAVEIRRVSSKTLVGSSPDNIRHFIELRGIGIINARRIFGIGSVKLTEKIDLVVNLEQWDSSKVYDRMGMVNEKTEILGLDITSLTIPVKPGRNLAVIIEVAAMNNRQRKMGYNAAQELLNKLGLEGEVPVTEDEKNIWSQF